MRLSITQAHRLVLLVLLALVAAGCDRVGDVASGAGSATKNLPSEISEGKPSEPDKSAAEEQTNGQSASGIIGESGSDSADDPEDDNNSEDEAEVVVSETRKSDFSLEFEMSHQSCSSCGIWFDSADLVIVHSQGRFTAQQSGSLLIKEAPYFQGRFHASLSSIPPSSTIESATLYMQLNAAEGISNDDFTSSISVYGYIGGSRRHIRDITAADDIKGKGYSKANPNVPIDFTAYTRQL